MDEETVMTEPGYGRLIDLERGDLLRLDDARGTTLRVTRGKLWVTQHRDLRDIVLVPGDVWTIERRGLTLARAEDDTSVALVGAGAIIATTRERGPAWHERLAGWLARLSEASLRRRWAPYI
jgi:hypothetical protein